MSIQSIAAEMTRCAPNRAELRIHAAEYCEMVRDCLRSAGDLLSVAEEQIAASLYPADLVNVAEHLEDAVMFSDLSLSASNRAVRR